MYESFHILIDDPASTLALGFDDYAAALAEIASVSRPQFSIGIFGAWGSGKTTLMRAMQADLARNQDVIPIWFNAWRYEREEHLIIPLLDTMREQVVEWGASAAPEAARKANGLAVALGRAARAVLTGMTLKAGIPGAVEVSLQANQVATAWRAAADTESAALGPKSFYHAAFLSLRAAVDDFVEGKSTPERRFVVFIDDIDRCLPEKALEVLESMKLFFDFEGFVFVVGLDQRVIERAVHLKYPAEGVDRYGESATYISGADYVKKIFQVQFTAPRIDQSELYRFLESLVRTAGLPDDQRKDIFEHVAPQIANLAGSSSVNPREVKRLINAYTMQMKILERKLRDIGSRPSADAVLALQIMSFRADWQTAYNALSNNPLEFVDSLKWALSNGESVIAVEEEVFDLPPSLLSYLANEAESILSLGDDLEIYVSSLEAARLTEPTVREVSRAFGRLRVAHRSAVPTGSTAIRRMLDELASRLSTFTSFSSATSASARIRRLIGDCPSADISDPAAPGYEQREKLHRDWLDQVGRELQPIGQGVADLRRRTTAAPTSA